MGLIYMVGQCCKSFQYINLNESKILLNLIEISQKTIMKKEMKDILLKMIFSILKNYSNVIIIYHFLPERIKIEKVDMLVTNSDDKTEYVIHIRNLRNAINLGLI